MSSFFHKWDNRSSVYCHTRRQPCILAAVNFRHGAFASPRLATLDRCLSCELKNTSPSNLWSPASRSQHVQVEYVGVERLMSAPVLVPSVRYPAVELFTIAKKDILVLEGPQEQTSLVLGKSLRPYISTSAMTRGPEKLTATTTYPASRPAHRLAPSQAGAKTWNRCHLVVLAVLLSISVPFIAYSASPRFSRNTMLVLGMEEGRWTVDGETDG